MKKLPTGEVILTKEDVTPELEKFLKEFAQGILDRELEDYTSQDAYDAFEIELCESMDDYKKPIEGVSAIETHGEGHCSDYYGEPSNVESPYFDWGSANVELHRSGDAEVSFYSYDENGDPAEAPFYTCFVERDF